MIIEMLPLRGKVCDKPKPVYTPWVWVLVLRGRCPISILRIRSGASQLTGHSSSIPAIIHVSGLPRTSMETAKESCKPKTQNWLHTLDKDADEDHANNYGQSERSVKARAFLGHN